MIYIVYNVCCCCVNHCIPINQNSIDMLRNVLIWSHAPSYRLATKMDLCLSHVSLGKACMYCQTWKANRQCFHDTEMQCTSLISAITHCLARKLYHTFWGLEERWKLLNISGWLLGLTSERFTMLNVWILFFTLITNTDPFSLPCNVSMHSKDTYFIEVD